MTAALVLHVEANSHGALVAEACKILGITPAISATPAPIPAPAAAVVATPEPSATLPTPAPRRGRPPRAAAPAPVVTPAANPVPTHVVTSPMTNPPSPAPAAAPAVAAPQAPAATAQPAVSGAFPTVEQTRAELYKVNEKFGMPTCSALMSAFGVDRISLVPEDKRAAFIEVCRLEAKFAKPVTEASTAEFIALCKATIAGKP